MRIFSTCIFLIVMLQVLTGQSVFPTYEDQPVWCLIRNYQAPPPLIESEYRLEMLKDTSICGKLYTPMIAKGIILSLSGEKEDVIAGYIRQEGNQVYQLLDSCQEILLYDFDRQLGDIIHYNFMGQDFTARIVEEVYFEIKGITRRVLTVIFESQYASEIHYWAEGLGDLNNPFMLWECITGEACEAGSGGVRSGGINCISDKNGVLYGDCPESCNINMTTNNNVISQLPLQFSITKNPLIKGEQLIVEYNVPTISSGTFSITNALGQVVHQEYIPALTYGGLHQLDWSADTVGMYWLTWQSDTGQRKVISFIVQ